LDGRKEYTKLDRETTKEASCTPLDGYNANAISPGSALVDSERSLPETALADVATRFQ